MIGDNNMTFIGSIGRNNQMQAALITAMGATNGNSPGHNVLDLNPAFGAAFGGDVASPPPKVIFYLAQTLTSAGFATVQFQVVQADDANLTTNVQVIAATDALPYTLLPAGTRIALSAGRAAPYTPRRYMGARVVIAVAPLTNVTPQFLASTAMDHQDAARSFNSGFGVA